MPESLAVRKLRNRHRLPGCAKYWTASRRATGRTKTSRPCATSLPGQRNGLISRRGFTRICARHTKLKTSSGFTATRPPPRKLVHDGKNVVVVTPTASGKDAVLQPAGH